MALMAMLLPATGLALPRLKEDIGLTPVQQGSLVSLQYLGFTIAVLLGGSLIGRLGGSKTLSLSFGVLGIAALIFSNAPNYPTVVLGVLLIGAFGSIIQNGITTLVTGNDPQAAEKNNSFVQMFFTVGAILTPALLLLSMLKLDNWKYVYYLISCLCFVVAVVALRYKEEKKSSETGLKDNLSVYIKAIKTPAYLIAPVALFLYLGVEIGLWGFAPVFFENQGYGKVSGVLASILIWISMLAGRAMSVRLLKKHNMISILVAHGILAAVSLVLIMFTGQVASIICIGVAGYACAPFYALLVTWMTKITGDTTSSALALTMAFGSIGAVLMGWISGMVVDVLGARYVTAVPAVNVLLLIFLLIIFRNKRV